MGATAAACSFNQQRRAAVLLRLLSLRGLPQQRPCGLTPCLGAVVGEVHTELQAGPWRTALLKAAGRRLAAEHKL